jgi:hypothetical protein
MRRCEVCDKPLSVRGRHVTGVCFSCRQAGAAFMAAWGRDLVTHFRGRLANAAAVLDVSVPTLRARLNDARRREAA